MANELAFRHTASGARLYATIRNIARQYWGASGNPGFRALSVGDWADYAIPLIETPGGSYFYVGDWPAALTVADWYVKELYVQGGEAPAISDALVACYASWWNGVSLVPSSSAAPAGSVVKTIQTNDVSGSPVAGVYVWTTSDQAGRRMVSQKMVQSDAGALATLVLLPGVQWVQMMAPGFQSPAPQQITV
jgi:hypothetical protein